MPAWSKLMRLRPTLATGSVATPVLALGASVDLTVTLSRAMPSAAYQFDILPAANILGNATFTIKSQTTTTIVITVKATLALTVGLISVVAYG